MAGLTVTLVRTGVGAGATTAMFTVAVTFTVPAVAVTVMIADPTATIVTRPVGLTVATAALLEA